MSTAESRLQSFVKTISHEQWIGLECLAIHRVLSSSHKVCSNTFQNNGFLAAMYDTAEERLLMALARVLDRDAQAVSVLSVCNYAQSNLREFVWLLDDAGKHKFPDAKATVIALCNKWRGWWEASTLQPKLRTLRDTALAHHDKERALGNADHIPLSIPEVADTLKDLGRFVNDFSYLIDCSETGADYLYEQIFKDGKNTLSQAEAMLRMLIGREVQWKEVISPLEQEIDAAHERLLVLK